MKIAVSCSGNEIWSHFGHCENFMIYDAENGKILSEQSVPNPGHKPGFLPNFLADMGGRGYDYRSYGRQCRRNFCKAQG